MSEGGFIALTVTRRQDGHFVNARCMMDSEASSLTDCGTMCRYFHYLA